MKIGIGRSVSAIVFASCVAVACGGSPPPPPKTPPPVAKAPPPPEPVRETIVPRTCAARTRLAQLLGKTEAPPTAAAEQAADTPPPPTSVASSAKLASNQAYRVVAPSTVLVRAERGFGTGVVIDPKGYVLTNYHVVADGSKKDFVITVDVTFGDLTATGRMNRQAKSYSAEVVKVDPVRDLAIVKVKEPPPKLVAAKLAKSAPQIAEKVMSIGHAGIGFLWAAKTCNVASIGERQQDSSIIAGVDCGHPDPALSATQAERQKKACEDQKKQMTDALASKTQGLALQTDCAITHGDSGGPLVNMAGEIVGLNQSISADLATAAFHVHLEELRDFASKYPEVGTPVLPDPYCDGGFEPSLEDLDLDGVAESLVAKGGTTMFGGYDRMSLLIDLDQDQSKRGASAKEGFDAEVALLNVHGTTYVWYDTDDDSRFDVMLVDKDNDGAPENAYRIDAQGRLTEDPKSLPKHDLSGKFVKNAALHPRLGKVATAIGGAKYVSERTLAAANDSNTVPDPYAAGGTEGRALDTDGNGRSDTAVMRTAFSRVTLIDADEDSLGKVKPGEAVEALAKTRKIDAEVAVVVQGSSVWALYDTDNDAKFDLALSAKSSDASGLFATAAFRIGGSGAPVALPEHLGRRLLRPGLVAFPRAEGAMRGLSSELATDEGLGTLPSPIPPRATFRTREVKGSPDGSVVETLAYPYSVQLFDVDHNSKIPPKGDVQKVVADGKFDAEVALVRRMGSDGFATWVYYDTDGDGKFDLVLYAPKSNQDPTQAFRVKKGPGDKTTLEVDSSMIAGRPIRHKSVFKDKALAAKWKTLANAVFKADFVEP